MFNYKEVDANAVPHKTGLLEAIKLLELEGYKFIEVIIGNEVKELSIKEAQEYYKKMNWKSYTENLAKFYEIGVSPKYDYIVRNNYIAVNKKNIIEIFVYIGGVYNKEIMKKPNFPIQPFPIKIRVIY